MRGGVGVISVLGLLSLSIVTGPAFTIPQHSPSSNGSAFPEQAVSRSSFGCHRYLGGYLDNGTLRAFHHVKADSKQDPQHV